MELGVYRALEQTLAFYSSVAVAWVGALVADLTINKPFGLSPPTHRIQARPPLRHQSRRRRCHGARHDRRDRRAIRRVSARLSKAMTPFLALLVSLICRPADRDRDTRSRFYLARKPAPAQHGVESAVRCCICENAFRVRGHGRDARPMPVRSARCAVRSTPAAMTCASRTPACTTNWTRRRLPRRFRRGFGRIIRPQIGGVPAGVRPVDGRLSF